MSMEEKEQIIVDQSRTSDAVLATVDRLFGAFGIGFGCFTIVVLVYALVTHLNLVNFRNLIPSGLVLLFVLVLIASVISSRHRVLVNPFPRLWLYQEGIRFRYWNENIVLDWNTLAAVRERSHDWKLWRRDRLTVYCDKLPESFGRFERYQNYKKKFYVSGDAINFYRLDQELRLRASVKDKN